MQKVEKGKLLERAGRKAIGPSPGLHGYGCKAAGIFSTS